MSALSIGKVAKRAGIGVETVRFYERRGLLEEPTRTASGYRQYDIEDIARLAFIQQAKSLGFSLKEVGELLSLKSGPRTTSREIKQLASAKLEGIEEKIKMLQKIRRTLKKLVNRCPGEGPASDCPILESLNSNDYFLR